MIIMRLIDSYQSFFQYSGFSSFPLETVILININHSFHLHSQTFISKKKMNRKKDFQVFKDYFKQFTRVHNEK